MKKASSGYLATAAMIAALYAVMTTVLWQFSSFGIQVRLSEALCVLPVFTPAAVPGLTLGCFLANMLGGNPLDAVVGSLATFLAAFCTRQLALRFPPESASFARRLLYPLPAVLWNALLIPLVLYYGYGVTPLTGSKNTLVILLVFALSVGAGQVIACYGAGLPLLGFLRKHTPEQWKKQQK